MQLYPLKLVTVVAEAVITKDIIAEGLSLGATGFTLTDVEGLGSRDARAGIMIGSTKTLTVEFVVSEAVAVAILEHISHTYFADYACIAWLSDVSVVRGEHYVALER